MQQCAECDCAAHNDCSSSGLQDKHMFMRINMLYQLCRLFLKQVNKMFGYLSSINKESKNESSLLLLPQHLGFRILLIMFGVFSDLIFFFFFF